MDFLGSTTRDRGVAALVRLLEDRFEERLREERKVVRRKVGSNDDDGLVHLGTFPIYLLFSVLRDTVAGDVEVYGENLVRDALGVRGRVSLGEDYR